MAEHNTFGKEAEELAVSFLEDKGFKILETNWRFKKAEIDIIALDKNELVIVEVKARNSIVVNTPESAVTAKKKRLLVEAANEFIQQKQLNTETRFDIISIYKAFNEFKINHLENAFSSFEIN